MESAKVKELRKKFGISDSRVEYTEEEILDLSQRKLHYIYVSENEDTDEILIKHKQVLGYISTDKKECIFIKDKEITHIDEYMPIGVVRECKKLKEGIYLDRFKDNIFCFTEDLQYCFELLKERIEREFREHIEELEEQLLTLRSTRIRIDVNNK